MLKEKKLKTITKYIFSKTKPFFDQVEIIIGSDDSTTIRFANNLIYQPMSFCSNWLKIRLIKNKKIVVLNSSSFSQTAINNTLRLGKKLVSLQKPDNNFVSLPKSKKIKISSKKSFDQKTANLPEENLVKTVFPTIRKAKTNKLIASGKVEKSVSEIAVTNSLGTWQYQPSTTTFFSTVLRNERLKISGYAENIGKNINDLNILKTTNQAIKTALKSKNPKKINPGEYEVIFMPAAFQEILPYFSWLGPNARIYHEEVSYLKGKINKKVFSPKLTMTDEPINNVSPAFFDFEGYPKKNIILIDKGIPKTICYDSYYGQKYNHKNTGHALPAPNTNGPLPTHLVIKNSQSSLEQMIKNVKNGLLISRLWYIRVIHYKSLMLTGMTRDGTFYIEDGKIKYPVQNLRFTDSIPNLFRNIQEVGKKSQWQKLMWGIAKIPPIRVSKFRFTS